MRGLGPERPDSPIEILAAGDQSVAAVFGLHRYPHVLGDDARCVSAANVARAALAFQALIESVVKS